MANLSQTLLDSTFPFNPVSLYLVVGYSMAGKTGKNEKKSAKVIEKEIPELEMAKRGVVKKKKATVPCSTLFPSDDEDNESRAEPKGASNVAGDSDDDIPEIQITKVVDTKKRSFGNAIGGHIMSPIAKKFAAAIRKRGIIIKAHTWTKAPTESLVKPVIIEVIDEKNDFTHWLMRPKHFCEVIEALSESDKGVSRFLHYCKFIEVSDGSGCPITKTVPKKSYNGGSASEVTIHCQALLSFMSASANEEDVVRIVAKAMKWIAHDQDFKDCYMASLGSVLSSNYAKEQLSPNGGPFWEMIDGAADHVNIETHETLNEVLLEDDIATTMITMFPGMSAESVTNRTLSSDLIKFAYGG